MWAYRHDESWKHCEDFSEMRGNHPVQSLHRYYQSNCLFETELDGYMPQSGAHWQEDLGRSYLAYVFLLLTAPAQLPGLATVGSLLLHLTACR